MCGPGKSIQITVERPTRVPSPAAGNKSKTLSTYWKKVTSNFPDTFRPQHRPRTSERPVAHLLHEAAHRTRSPSRSARQGATTVGWNPTSFQVARGDTSKQHGTPENLSFDFLSTAQCSFSKSVLALLAEEAPSALSGAGNFHPCPLFLAPTQPMVPSS